MAYNQHYLYPRSPVEIHFIIEKTIIIVPTYEKLVTQLVHGIQTTEKYSH